MATDSTATNVEALATLAELIEECREGRFYDDYDHSLELLGRASKALDVLTAVVVQRRMDEDLRRIRGMKARG